MRILHLIPSAFHYFDAARDKVFELVEAEGRLGLEVEAFTLGYSQPNERFQQRVKILAPSRTFEGNANLNEVMASFSAFDIIHVHYPLLGAASAVIRWKKAHPDRKLVVTDHGPFIAPDLFGVFISWYNVWYKSKLFKVADALVDLTAVANAIQLRPEEYKTLYLKLINNVS